MTARSASRPALWLALAPLTLAVTVSCGGKGKGGSGNKEAWDRTNDPGNFGVATAVYDQIPTEATLPESAMPWSDFYWSTQRGGTSYRWQSMPAGQSYRDFLYDFPSPEQAQALGEDALALLSPAEKYDILRGRYDLPLARAERANTLRSVAGADVPSWYGLCHGWAPAAYMERQPGAAVNVTAANGKRVTFYTSDIKALLTKVYADFLGATRFIGGRCNDQQVTRDAFGRATNPACRDTNPGSFHLVVSDYVARQKKSFVVDVESGAEVWNQPVTGYRFRYANFRALTQADRLRAVRAPNAAYLVDVDMTLAYAVETMPQKMPFRTVQTARRFLYSLELDAEKRIVGGEWTSEERPDFLWEIAEKPQGVRGELDAGLVRRLLSLSLGETPSDNGGTPSPRVASVRVTPEALDVNPGATATVRAEALDVTGQVVTATFTYATNGGSIDATGLYQAPLTPGSYAIAVKETSTGIQKTIPVTVGTASNGNANVIARLDVAPTSLNLNVNDVVTFAPRALNRDGNALPGTFAFAAMAGSIDASGRYRAPGAAGSDTITVRETTSGLTITVPVTVRDGGTTTPPPGRTASLRMSVWDTDFRGQAVVEGQVRGDASTTYTVAMVARINGVDTTIATRAVRGGETFRMQGRWTSGRPSRVAMKLFAPNGDALDSATRDF